MEACDRHTENGEAARERMGIALEISARAERTVVARGAVLIEPDAPERICNR